MHRWRATRIASRVRVFSWSCAGSTVEGDPRSVKKKQGKHRRQASIFWLLCAAKMRACVNSLCELGAAGRDSVKTAEWPAAVCDRASESS